jgi:hypothetical protein
VVKRFRDSKVSELDLPIAGKEYVLGLDVPVDDLTVMYMLYSQGKLDEPGQNLLF